MIYVDSCSYEVRVILGQILMKIDFFSTDFLGGKKYHIKFHENPCRGSRVVPCGRTDMAKLIVALVSRMPPLRVSSV